MVRRPSVRSSPTRPRYAPICRTALTAIVIDAKERPDDPIYCVIHDKIGTRGARDGRP